MGDRAMANVDGQQARRTLVGCFAREDMGARLAGSGRGTAMRRKERENERAVSLLSISFGTLLNLLHLLSSKKGLAHVLRAFQLYVWIGRIRRMAVRRRAEARETSGTPKEYIRYQQQRKDIELAWQSKNRSSMRA